MALSQHEKSLEHPSDRLSLSQTPVWMNLNRVDFRQFLTM